MTRKQLITAKHNNTYADELCDRAENDEFKEQMATQSPEEAMSAARIQVKQSE